MLTCLIKKSLKKNTIGYLVKVLIRPFKPEDANFIISTWIKSSYSNATGYREKQSTYHKGLEHLIKKKYEAGELMPYVACLEGDEDLLLGFAVYGNDYTLHYCYTKEAFKRQGICKALLSFMLRNKTEITVSFWTKDIAFIKKLYKVNYNRFKFFN